jgi:glycosyltransferase involved in cell wall biosynthesis
MTVLQLGPYPPPHGGVQTNLVAIREHLRRHGVRAPVINLTRHRHANGDDVYYPRTARQVIKLLHTIRADVVHLHIGGQLSPRLLALCLVCALVPGRKAVLTFHSGGYPAWGRRGARAASLRGFIFRRLDAIIAVNAEIADLFRSLGVPADRVKVICPYAPVSVSGGVDLTDELRRFRRAHDPLLTTVGLLEPEYDLPFQIESLAAIRQRFPNAGLVIIGSGSLEPQLRQLIESQADGRHVLLCGDVAHPLTIRVMAESDLFLRTTLYDGDSVSVREALQLGVPVIATDNGMRPAGVHLLPRSNADALCEAIDAVLRGRATVGRLPEATNRHLDEVLELYSTLAGHRLELGRSSVSSSSSL